MAQTPFSQQDIFVNTTYDVVGNLMAFNANIFNERSNNCIRMDATTFAGNARQTSNVRMPKDGLLRYRDPTGDKTLSTLRLYRDTDNEVRFSMGTNPLVYTNAEFNTLKQDPKLAAAQYGQTVGITTSEELAKLSVAVLATCLKSDARVVTDVSSRAKQGNVAMGIIQPIDFVTATTPFGDRMNDLSIIVLHSKVYLDLMAQNVFNNANDRVYNLGSMIYREDLLGRRYLITDNPALYDSASKKYTTLGLRTGHGVRIGMNSDLTTLITPKTGKENISYEIQSEWTNTLKVDNYRYRLGSDDAAALDYAKMVNAGNWEIIDNSSPKLQSGFVITSL